MRLALLCVLALLASCRCPHPPVPDMAADMAADMASPDMTRPDLASPDMLPTCLPPSAPCTFGPGPQCCDGIACGPSGRCLP